MTDALAAMAPNNRLTDPGFWDRIATKYALRPVGNPEAYAATLDRVRHWLKPTDRALEIGCGTGSTALSLADAVQTLTASDFSAGMIDIARAKDVPDNVTFVVGTAGSPALGTQTYDTVMAFNLLHLVPDLDTHLSEIAALTRPGGLFISKTPCLSNGMGWLRPVIWAMQLVGKAPFVNFLSTDTVEDVIARAGFEIVEAADYPAKRPPSHFIVARKL